MGSGRWDPDAYRDYTSTTIGASTADVFKTATKRANGLDASLNPLGVALRESRDSADNPQSTAVIVGLDVTGSMGMIADTLARKGLGTLFEEILSRKPVTDPHLMFMAIGDANSDRYPLQVSQFEADARIIEQLTNIYLEGGGGGNSFESYNLPWYFAAMHTSIDCFEKRGKKGYLFTVGDEGFPSDLTQTQLKRFVGDDIEASRLDNETLLARVQQMYHVFHVVVEEGMHCRYFGADKMVGQWQEYLGQHVLRLSDHTKLSEVIVSAISVVEGSTPDEVAATWSGDTSLVVRNAIGGLVPASGTGAGGIVRL